MGRKTAPVRALSEYEMKVATIKTYHNKLYGKDARPTSESLDEAYKKALASGVMLHSDGRAYIPEKQRGKGVGYGRHGAG